MGDLKPLGSEKLPLDDKIKRIMEIARYKDTPKDAPKNGVTSTVHFIKESANGFYGVVKEKDGYYVKHGLNESSLNYIGGMMMKNKNRFNSYGEALKRLELISKPLTEQEKKYILSTNKTVDENPGAEPAMDDVPPAPTDGGEGVPPADDEAMPTDDAAMPDAGSEPAPDGDDMGGDLDAPMDGQQMSSEQLKGIQKLTGKLGQRLRAAAEIMKSDDIKYVINSMLSAVDLEKLEPEDKDAIASRFEDDNDYDQSGEVDNVDTTNSEFGDDDMGGDAPTPDGDGGEELPVPSGDEEEMGEDYDDIFENFSRLEKALLGEAPVKKVVKKKK